jgi:hypothetical protein
MYYLSSVCSLHSHVLLYPCTLRCLHMYYPCLSAQHKLSNDLNNNVTHTATVEQKRLRRFSCCLVLTLFRVTLFNLRLFITIPQ